jgi:hypothetical protein
MFQGKLQPSSTLVTEAANAYEISDRIGQFEQTIITLALTVTVSFLRYLPLFLSMLHIQYLSIIIIIIVIMLSPVTGLFLLVLLLNQR